MEPDKEPETIVKQPETVTKSKHPGRVEAGKRLAELNRQKKLKKLKDSTQVQKPEPETTTTSSFPLYYLGLVPVVIYGAYKLYKRTRGTKSILPSFKSKIPRPVEEIATKTPTTSDADPFEMQ